MTYGPTNRCFPWHRGRLAHHSGRGGRGAAAGVGVDIRIGLVTGQRTAVHHAGSEAGRLLQVQLTDGYDVQTVEVPQAGVEYNPPPGTRVAVICAGSAYKLAAVFDDGVPPVMAVGGYRIYSTDSTGETPMADVRLQPDGTVVVANGAASFSMAADGTFSFHGVSSSFDHNVVITGSLTATEVLDQDGGKSMSGMREVFNTHRHNNGALPAPSM